MCDLDQLKIQAFVKKSGARLERETGISRETWSRWFSHKRSPTLAHLTEIAPKLDLNLLELVAGIEQKHKIMQEKKEQQSP